jgi:subfamily B ATP-binding cassette protein MsbA
MPVLFEGSVKDNLLLGKPDATEEEIIAATKAANAHDFISKLSNGYGKPFTLCFFVCFLR